MSEQNGHPKAPLLQELADEAKVNPEPWKAFECLLGRDRLHFKSLYDMLCALSCTENTIRRRPKTIRVSGEVPEDVVKWSRTIAGSPGHNKIGSIVGETGQCDVARALLSLVEESQ